MMVDFLTRPPRLLPYSLNRIELSWWKLSSHRVSTQNGFPLEHDEIIASVFSVCVCVSVCDKYSELLIFYLGQISLLFPIYRYKYLIYCFYLEILFWD